MKNLNQNDVNQETKKLLKYVQPCTLSFDMPFSLLFLIIQTVVWLST